MNRMLCALLVAIGLSSPDRCAEDGYVGTAKPRQLTDAAKSGSGVDGVLPVECWNDTAGTLSIAPANEAVVAVHRTLTVRAMPGTETTRVNYRSEKTTTATAP